MWSLRGMVDCLRLLIESRSQMAKRPEAINIDHNIVYGTNPIKFDYGVPIFSKGIF